MRKKTPLLFVFLDYRANMQTPHTKLPQREAPPPQAHTTSDTMDLQKPMQQMATDLGSTSIIPQGSLQELLSNLQALSQMNSCPLDNQVLEIHFKEELKSRICSFLSSALRVYMDYVLCVGLLLHMPMAVCSYSNIHRTDTWAYAVKMAVHVGKFKELLLGRSRIHTCMDLTPNSGATQR